MNIIKRFIFRGKNKEIEELKEIITTKDKRIDELKKLNSFLNKELGKECILNTNLKQQLDETNKIAAESLSKALNDNNKLKDELLKTKKLNQELGYAKGGLTKRNNELIAENTSLAYKIIEIKNEFEEFKKNKFVVKKLKAEKVPKATQTMGMRSGTKTSKIISKVKPTEREIPEIHKEEISW